MAGARAGKLKVRASFRRAELALVRTVAAIVLRVALPGRGDATIVGTGELVGVASDVRTAHFVAVITAVVLGIAVEGHGYAATGFTLELARAARRFRAVLHLVAVIQAVVLPVAHPGFWDAPVTREKAS